MNGVSVLVKVFQFESNNGVALDGFLMGYCSMERTIGMI